MDNNKNFRKNEITYADDWQSVSTPEYPETLSPDNNEYDNDTDESEPIKKEKKKRETPRQLLIIIQLIICIIICAAAYLLKSVGGDLYETFRTWYETELNSQLVAGGNINDIDFSDILNSTATQDEV